jgi:hypothetical protein
MNHVASAVQDDPDIMPPDTGHRRDVVRRLVAAVLMPRSN